MKFPCSHCRKQIEISGEGDYFPTSCPMCSTPVVCQWVRTKMYRGELYFFCSVAKCRKKLKVADLPTWHAEMNKKYKGKPVMI